jgi:hypothetical protein
MSNPQLRFSFDVEYWPDEDPAHCGAILDNPAPGVFSPVWGDQYCANSVNGSFLPMWWYWNQSWPSTGYTLRIDSKHLVTAGICNECDEFGSHDFASDLFLTGTGYSVYKGRTSFGIRPRTLHG